MCSAGVVWCLMAALAMTCAGQHGRRAVNEVEADYLLNFTHFITWPGSAFADAASPFTICILGEDPFGSVLDRRMEGETANGRKIMVRRIKEAPARKSCQVLFLSGTVTDVPDILQGVGTGVLTVSERAGFLGAGGIINFALDGRHVRFDISQRAASQALLTVSARLLNVARSVLK